MIAASRVAVEIDVEETISVAKEASVCGSSLFLFVCWLVGCLTSQQHASISQGRICSDNLYVLPH